MGADPCTRECLKDDQIYRTPCDARPQDETNLLMKKLNEANNLSTFDLAVSGYQGRLLKDQREKAAELLPITMTHMKERIELLGKPSSYGQKLFTRRGTHVTEDDFFCTSEVPVSDAKIRVMEVRKTECNWL